LSSSVVVRAIYRAGTGLAKIGHRNAIGLWRTPGSKGCDTGNCQSDAADQQRNIRSARWGNDCEHGWEHCREERTHVLRDGHTVASISTASLIHAADLENSFFSDSKANLRLRNFYINTDNRDGTGVSKKEEWGQGFMLDFQSGYTPGTVGFGVDALGMLGVKLDDGGRVGKAGEDRQPGSMFPQNSDGSAVDDFSSLGLTAKMKISKTELRYGTLIPKMPVLMSNDGRLLPQMFQGGQITSSDLDNFKFTAGQIERVKSRMSSSSDGLSIAGANNARTGRFSNQFRFGGVDYQPSKNLMLQYYYGELEHFYQQHFVGAVHNLALGPGVLKSDLRYFHSTSTDENANTPAYFTSGFYGSRVVKSTMTCGARCSSTTSAATASAAGINVPPAKVISRGSTRATARRPT
jgi:hypothetical protein